MLGNAGGKTGMANRPQSFFRYPIAYRKSIPSSERDKITQKLPFSLSWNSCRAITRTVRPTKHGVIDGPTDKSTEFPFSVSVDIIMPSRR